ncbi:MAG TPA: alpha-amylase family protein [Puia sp.]|jgi:maltose alpha-D-glucosyltransferase/alpha-amylase|nr:alpha-amylase family protein [Puia sp.]
MRLPPIILATAIALAVAGPAARAQSSPTQAASASDTLAGALRETAADRWYKNSFIYNLDVHTFQDSDGDGIGDFRGLIARLPYLKGLGVDCIWLAPFQPSPRRDDGYDVTDYYGVDTACGTRGDLAQFIYRAHSLGIRVIMDMVLDHSSDQHPWFLRASADTSSPWHRYYFWSSARPADQYQGVAFPGPQKEVWTWQSHAHQYYYHRFYDFQPHLNLLNPDVFAESQHILGYWLSQGFDGFRLDAVPFMVEIPRTDSDRSPQALPLLTALRQFVQYRRGDALLVGEANVPPEQISDYFGKTGDRIQMLFNFYGNQYLFYALASHDVTLFRRALITLRNILPVSQWCWFLRNHDEIDLGRLTTAQREFVYRQFGPDKNMQLYDRGIRRRLAPMLHDDRELTMAYSLLFSLPGAVEIHYGEELGMGDDLSLEERLSVRTPMPWTHERNAGFTNSPHPTRPLAGGEYGYEHRNVADEDRDSSSLLGNVRRFARLRKECPEIGLGTWAIADSSRPQLLVLRFDYQGQTLITVHNFSPGVQQLSLDPAGHAAALTDLISGTILHPAGRVFLLSVPPYGYAWYRLTP